MAYVATLLWPHYEAQSASSCHNFCVAATAAVAAAGKANFNEANKFSLMSTANRFANIKELLHLKAL